MEKSGHILISRLMEESVPADFAVLRFFIR